MAAFLPRNGCLIGGKPTAPSLVSIFSILLLTLCVCIQTNSANAMSSEPPSLELRHLPQTGQSFRPNQNSRLKFSRRSIVRDSRTIGIRTINLNALQLLKQSRDRTSSGQMASWEAKVQRSSRDSLSEKNVNSSRTILNATNPDRTAVSRKAIRAKLQTLLANPNGENFFLSKQHREILKKFYAENNYRLFWLTDRGFTGRAIAVIEEFKRAEDYGLKSAEFAVPSLKFSASELARSELILSSNILLYANHAEGGRLDPRQLSKSIDREPNLTEPNHVLKVISKQNAPDRYLRSFHPQHYQFDALREKLLNLRQINSKQSEVQRVLVNMERWRWMPKDLGQFYVWASIPEFRVRVVDNRQIIHEANIVVGKVTNKTPLFSDKMEYLVFHPYWNVPKSIKAAEIMPHLRRSTNILRKENLKVRLGGQDINPYQVDWKHVDARPFDFYQPPGRKNVLGTVKFMFPNKHIVYMHDTPSKHLLSRQVRLYSHGCMRVQNPEILAKILLNRDKGWPGSQVDDLIRSRARQRVDLSQTIPVHITYFTASVDPQGNLKFFDDYYGYDQLIAEQLIGESHLIPSARYVTTSAHTISTVSSPNTIRNQTPRSRRTRAAEWRRNTLQRLLEGD